MSNVVDMLDWIQENHLRKVWTPWKNRMLRLSKEARKLERRRILEGLLKDHENPQLKMQLKLLNEVESD